MWVKDLPGDGLAADDEGCLELLLGEQALVPASLHRNEDLVKPISTTLLEWQVLEDHRSAVLQGDFDVIDASWELFE